MVRIASPQIADPQPVTSLDQIRASKPEMVYYSAGSCWWTTNPDHLFPGPVPLDPAGSPLYQTDDVEGFLKDAEEHPNHYGKHGLKAFILAYHGNVVDAERGDPVCNSKWKQYNDLLDWKKVSDEGAEPDGTSSASSS